MSGRDEQSPLTIEERALAQRLARTGAAAEPAPALDARILAAARQSATAQERATPVSRGLRHWPVGLGLAASLVLAVGVAWQLRPLPDAGIEYSEAPAETARHVLRDAAAPAAVELGATLPGETRREDLPTSMPPSREPERDHARPVREAAAGREAAAMEAETGPPSATEPGAAGTLRAASPMAFPTAPAEPVAPSPSQPDRPVPRSADSQVSKPQQDANQARPSAATRADAAAAQTAPYRRSEDLTGAHDEPYDDQPPASADSPEVRRAWLSRIRELVSEGRIDPARDSLREFRRRYPQEPVPEDLQPLLD